MTHSIEVIEEAAEKSWMNYEYRFDNNLYSTCYKDAFKAGAKWQQSQQPESGYDSHPPIGGILIPKHETGEWQLCPKCNGQGIVNKPPYVAGDQFEWSASTVENHTCNLCNGAKVLARPIIQQPESDQKGKEPIEDAEKFVEENFKGLAHFIDDKDVLAWYKSLIVTALTDPNYKFHKKEQK